MFRMTLFSFLATVIAAGPTLCCCGFGVLSAVPAHAIASQPVSAGCPHCAKAKQDVPAPPPSREKCPCRQSATCCGFLPPATKASDSSIADWLTLLAAAAHGLAIDPVFAGPQCGILFGVASHQPFWDPSDLLDF